VQRDPVAETTDAAEAFDLDASAFDPDDAAKPYRRRLRKGGGKLASLKTDHHQVAVNIAFNFCEYSSGVKVKET
jgi:hypothetical protein